MKGKMLTSLNEKDTLTDVLLFEKQLLEEYARAVAESDKSYVRKAIVKNFSSEQAAQLSVYTLMNERGYYIPALAEKEEIKSKIDDFKDFLQ